VVFFVKPRMRYLIVAGFYVFHLVTFCLITISFVPHQIAMASFLPLEKVTPVRWARGLRGRRSPAAQPPSTSTSPSESAPAGA
jgi:hypothetical protein